MPRRTSSRQPADTPLPETAPRTLVDAVQQHRTQSAIASRAHYMLAERDERRHQVLGMPVVVFAAVAAGFAFAQPGDALTYLIGGLSTLAATFAGVQTFLNPLETARQHREAGRQYASVRRAFDVLLLNDRESPRSEDLATLHSRLDGLAESSPIIPDRVYDKARATVSALGGGPVSRVVSEETGMHEG